MAGEDRVQDVDLGYADVVRLLRDLDVHIDVGILQDRGGERTEDGGITLAGYAAVNEFGSADGHVPERSFLRSTMAENERRYIEEIVDAARGVIVDGADVKQSFGLVGAGAVADVQDKIRDIRSPANAPSTLSRKYPGDNPLIDTGRMRQSISFDVVQPSGTDSGSR